MHINRITKERLIFETAKAISAILEKEQDKDILLMLAGGSAFDVYNSISPQWLSNHATLSMTDDRFSHELDINNSHVLQATDFYNEAINADTYYISTEVWNEEKPEELAKRFEYGLRQWRAEFPDGVVIAVFGMGEDGHTCGIIPGDDMIPDTGSSDKGVKKINEKSVGKSDGEGKTFQELFENDEKWVAGYTTPNNEYHERITITMPFIKKYVNHAVSFISGEKKRVAFDRLLADTGSLEATPVRVLRELKNVEIFTDIADPLDVAK